MKAFDRLLSCMKHICNLLINTSRSQDASSCLMSQDTKQRHRYEIKDFCLPSCGARGRSGAAGEDKGFKRRRRQMQQSSGLTGLRLYKVLTTKVIGPLDDRTYCGRSAFTELGTFAKAVRLFITSLHNQPMYLKMCTNYIFVNLQPVG